MKSHYFVFKVEGKAPDDMKEDEVLEQLNESLPEWVDGKKSFWSTGAVE